MSENPPEQRPGNSRADKAIEEQKPHRTRRILLALMGLGAALGIALAFAAHYSGMPALLNNLGPLGAFLSLITGLTFGLLLAAGPQRPTLLGGTVVGASCAFAGIAASVLLGDVILLTLPLGTVGGAVAGLAGSQVGRLVGKARR